MSLTKELLQILDNDTEPLKKRLKIADNAFKSTELPIRRKEFVLLEWLGNTKKSESKDNAEIWIQCYNWLSSEQFRGINRNEIQFEDYNKLIEVLVKNLSSKDSSIRENILKSISCLVENRIFQQHFKNYLEDYLINVCKILTKISEKERLLTFLRNPNLFNKYYLVQEKFHELFIDHVIPTLVKISTSYEGDTAVFKDVSRIIETCIFERTKKQFNTYIKSELSKTSKKKTESNLPKLIFQKLKKSYADDDSLTFKLMFHAFCKNHNAEMIFGFCYLTTKCLGVNSVEENKSSKINLNTALKTYSEMLEELKETNTQADCKLIGHEINFTAYLKTMLKNVIALTKTTNTDSFKIIMNTFEINPLILEELIEDVLVYIFLNEKKGVEAIYEETLVAILNVYAKLHRVQNFVLKIITTLQSNVGAIKEGYGFVENVLTENFMERFTECIAVLESWQVNNIYKTLLYHLNDVFGGDSEDNGKILVTEVICALLANFLASVRIAEHTVSSTVLDKFITIMEEQYEILKKFGTSLVHKEHNHRLMRNYLKMCHNWAELYMMIKYYSEKELKIEYKPSTDFSACNITYLHSYLSPEHWCLISQRITNFGEKPCKEIMFKLCVQKLRAISIFKQEIQEELFASISQMISNSVNDLHKCVTSDPFILSTILPKMDQASLQKLAECVTQKPTSDYKKLANSKHLTEAILLYVLTKINGLFKPYKSRVVCSKVGKELLKENVWDEEFDLSEKSAFIMECLEQSNMEVDGDDGFSNEGDLKKFLDIIEQLPVLKMGATLQNVLFVYLLVLVVDLNKFNVEKELKIRIEYIILDIVRKGCVQPFNLVKSSVLINVIIENFNQYSVIFGFLLEAAIKAEKSMKGLKSVASFLTKDITTEKHTNCSIIFLKFIIKHKKSKHSHEIKDMLDNYRKKINGAIMENIEEIDSLNSIEGFTMVLRYYLSSDDQAQIDESMKHVEKYIDKVFETANSDGTEIKGWALFFSTLFQYKSKYEKIINDDFIQKVWQLVNTFVINDEDPKLHSSLIAGIFEYISNDQLKTISDELLNKTVAALRANNLNSYKNTLYNWNAIVSCYFNKDKMCVLQNCLQTHLCQLSNSLRNIVNDDIVTEVVKFENKLINNTQISLTPAMIDAVFYTISYLNSHSVDFVKSYLHCLELMESLLKHRSSHMTDRIPSYLQQYRNLMKKLCKEADADVQRNEEDFQQIANCAHNLERLTNKVTVLEKHVSSVAMYVITDILSQYETVTLYPAVKLHLNNCLYVFIGMLDQHAISCLMRVLSTASTEIFKLQLNTYKKYYKFTGKV